MPNRYHHGDLRQAALDLALERVTTDGPAGVSLRAIAKDLGVSHTAPRHHFGSSRGLLTAVAVDGYRELGRRLSSVRTAGGSFLDVGVAYVGFALDRRAHFAVMFAPTLLDLDDAGLTAAMDATWTELRTGVDVLSQTVAVPDAAAAVLASWSLVHGLATLALTGNLDRSGVRELVGESDLLALTRRTAALLHGASPPPSADRSEHPR